MKLFKIIIYLFLPIVLCNAQEKFSPETYILSGVEISGNHNLTQESIMTLLGLSIGQKITIPSEDISNGLQNLWNQNLFSDIQISKIEKNKKEIILDIYLETHPLLTKFKFQGVKKSEEDNLREEIKLNIGMPISNNLIQTSENKIKKYFIEKGYLNATCEVNFSEDSLNTDRVKINFKINKKNRVKIGLIQFQGNNNVKATKLKRLMKNTREQSLRFLFSSSKLINENYKDDLEGVIQYYHTQGFRDVIIKSDSIYISNDEKLILDIVIDEGKQYLFGDISWLGNKKYESMKLGQMLGIKRGDVFDTALLDERLNMSRNGDDISALYMDDGYLFFQINPIETSIDENNYINLEVRITEGKQATINSIQIQGNTKTNDHVIMREVRSLPGDLFKRSNIIRTQEEFNRLGFFNPETLGVNPIPDPKTGNVDIIYSVEEKPADQVELQGGWGNGMFVGSFGISFSNFSTSGIFDKSTWDPLPTGDGQKIRLRAQSNGTYYQNYSISFEEPWLGGNKPNAFSIALWKSIQSFSEENKMQIFGGSVGLGKRLKWPDDYFTIQNSLNIQRYEVEGYDSGAFNFINGYSNNINLSTSIIRSSIFNPIYPRYGSKFLINFELTPPYSLLNNKDYETLSDSEKYKFLEYKKIKGQGTWFNSITGNLVLKSHFEFGFLSGYNDILGPPPFQRFYVGGDGLSGYSIDGREIIALRGYENNSLSGDGGSPIYTKYNFELRYPISLNPSSTIYALCFAEAGNAWNNIEEFNPFQVKRSMGMGIRIFMPMFGMLGVDFGHGFDNKPGFVEKSGWQTHFTIGQQF
ncbi:outer membrane protein assembly factor BamA [Flavobacteriales bacterium]|nr:outer membrane protein assembly factor BamA [Flavobacteriales bacterium]